MNKMSALFVYLQLCLAIAWADGASSQQRSSSNARFLPGGLHVGSVPRMPARKFQEFTLDTNHPMATLDYGTHGAGIPLFEIATLSGPCQIEMKYSEQFSGLHESLGDGPSTFVSSLANSYRVETFNVSSPGHKRSTLIQGGQRWQTVRLMTNGTVTFRSVSFEPTVAHKNVSLLPGTFKSSNTLYDQIWNLGARAVSLACYDAGTQQSIWNVSSNGALITSSVPSYTANAYNFTEYTLEFDAKILRGGIQWSMGYNFGIRSRGGIQLNLAGNYPAETTFANTNSTLFPPSTIAMGYGVAFVNQTTLTSYFLDTFPVTFDVQEGIWYRISSTIQAGRLAVSIHNNTIFNVSLSDYYVGSGSSISTSGSFGFGAWQDQSGLIRNVVALDTTGNLIYKNSLTNTSQVLAEYGVEKNFYSTCVDGARRDRLVWLGDFLHTVRIVGITTGRKDHIKGTFSQLFVYQLATGQLPMAPSLGYSPSIVPKTFAVGGNFGSGIYPLPDYHILALISFVSYMESWNDIQFAKEIWPSLQNAVEWLSAQHNNQTGLIDLSSYVNAFLGPTDGIAVNAAAVEAFSGMSSVAAAVEDDSSAARWMAMSASLKTAINAKLWNEELGVYSLAPSSPNDFSVSGIAFAISSGVANKTQALSSLEHLPTLRLGPGYRDASTVKSNDTTANLSPNTNGFLLPALIRLGKVKEARFLLENLWGAMVSNNATYSGASWEYVNQEGNPGLGQYTSLSHPWGGAATYSLTHNVVGIRPTKFGYKSWIVEPAYVGFGLDEVESTVPTPYGDIKVDLLASSNQIRVRVKSPAGTKGRIALRKSRVCPEMSSRPGCSEFHDFVRDVVGGSSVQFTITLP